MLIYIFQVVCLRESERHLLLHCEELELQTGEQEVVLREMEAAMQRLALDADRRLTQQRHDHQNNVQVLLQKLNTKQNTLLKGYNIIFWGLYFSLCV